MLSLQAWRSFVFNKHFISRMSLHIFFAQRPSHTWCSSYLKINRYEIYFINEQILPTGHNWSISKMLLISFQFKFLKSWKIYFILSFAPLIPKFRLYLSEVDTSEQTHPLWKSKLLSDWFMQNTRTSKTTSSFRRKIYLSKIKVFLSDPSPIIGNACH